MSILTKLRGRQRDMKTLSALIESSLAMAAAAGEERAGAHHLALAAFEMGDGLAEQALATLERSGQAFADALATLDADILAGLGLESEEAITPPPPVPRGRLGKTDATFEAAIKAIYLFHNEAGDGRALTSAHVLAGVASVEHGVSARVFATLGLDRDEVIEACRTLDQRPT